MQYSDSFNREGNSYIGLRRDIQLFHDRTEYQVLDFTEATVLYNHGMVDNDLVFKVYRPCDMENYRSTKNEYRKIDIDEIPESVLDKSDAYEHTICNVAFIFEEGDREERILFMDSLGGHSFQRLPVDTAIMTDARAHLLAETLLFVEEAKAGVVIRKTEDGDKIVGFYGKDKQKYSIKEYVDSFIDVFGHDIALYHISDENTKIMIKYGERVGDMIPCVALTLSDCGHGASKISVVGLLTNGTNLSIDLKNWEIDASEDPFTYISSMKGEIESEVESIFDSFEALNAEKLEAESSSEVVAAASKVISSIPNHLKKIGQKSERNIYNALAQEPMNNSTKLDFANKLIDLASKEATTTYTKQSFREIGSLLLNV